ncbi:MAG: glycerophosphodiester phosphodiesterase family protein, partial [Dissulfuribacterales bacterium]
MFIAIVGGLLVLYLYAIKPGKPARKKIEPFLGRYYAHRGLFDNNADTPENSLKAIIKAVQNGYGVEFDVRLTQDNIPVVVHDNKLRRVSGVDGLVTEMAFKELQVIRLFESQEEVPTLRQVLDIVGGKVPAIVELK